MTSALVVSFASFSIEDEPSGPQVVVEHPTVSPTKGGPPMYEHDGTSAFPPPKKRKKKKQVLKVLSREARALKESSLRLDRYYKKQNILPRFQRNPDCVYTKRSRCDPSIEDHKDITWEPMENVRKRKCTDKARE